MSKLSQRDIVLRQLKEHGVITNLWAIEHYILRLGAVIENLRKDGLEIETEYNTPKVGKNTHYWLKTPVKKTVYRLPDGREIISRSI